MSHDARSIANEFITRALESNRAITPLQTLKLVFFAQGWMLAIHDRPLIKQRFYAWKLGPVVPDVYHALKHYGWHPIFDPIDGVAAEEYDDYELNVIAQVFETYSKFSGTYLSALTHAKDTPWEQVWDPNKRNILIPNRLIKDFYVEQLH